jgi:hypothetical protein
VDAIHLPAGLTLPSAFGAPAAPLQPGQVVQALVLELIESDVFRLQLPQAVVDVRSSVPLTPGSTITLAVKGAGPSAKLVIYSDAPSAPVAVTASLPGRQPSAPAAAGSSGQAPPPSLAGREPIGEAVVIARAPAGPAAMPAGQNAAPTRNPLGPAVLRDAPSIALKSVASAAAARAPDAPARILTPEQAVGEAIRVAAPRQAGLAPLFADVEQVAQVVAGKTQAPLPAPALAAPALPAPVRAAAADVLSLRVPLDEQLTASDVKQAFVRSGVLFEPRLAAARATPADGRAPHADLPAPASTSSTSATRNDLKPAPTPANDLKAALLVFRQVLKTWAAAEPATSRPAAMSTQVTAPAASGAPEAVRAQAQAPLPSSEVETIRHAANALAGLPDEPIRGAPLSAEQATSLAKTLASAMVARGASPVPSCPAAASLSAVPPPYRGAPLAGQAPAAPSIAPDDAPHDIAERLIAGTDGALARQTLLQVASLPEQPDLPRAEAAQRWSFEVPFATPQGTAIAQFEVSRDGRAPKADPQTRVWRARFSLDTEPMGPVHAMIALAGARTSVTLWAERITTATRLNEGAPMLRDALRAAELEPADFQARVGAPPQAAKQAAPGRFMDRAS